jgi:hypothetical protein
MAPYIFTRNGESSDDQLSMDNQPVLDCCFLGGHCVSYNSQSIQLAFAERVPVREYARANGWHP